MNSWKVALYAGGSALIMSAAFKLLNKNLSIFESIKDNCDTGVHEVLVYGAENEEERKSLGRENLFCIHFITLQASHSVDVCVPSLISETLAKCLINVQRSKNKKIRILIHNSNNLYNLNELSSCGIEIKIVDLQIKLGHEFIIIDAVKDFKEAVAIIGALDYEIAYLNYNRDTTIITSEIGVIRALKTEFDRVWESSNVTQQYNAKSQ